MGKTQAFMDGRELANVFVEEEGYSASHNGYAYWGGNAITCVRCGGQVEASAIDEDQEKEWAEDTLVAY